MMLLKCTAISLVVFLRHASFPKQTVLLQRNGMVTHCGSVLSPVDSRSADETLALYTLQCCFNLYVVRLQLSYNMPKTQLEFLQVSSRFASQTFTYHCRNSVASVIFKTQNNKEISATNILHDGCQVCLCVCVSRFM